MAQGIVIVDSSEVRAGNLEELKAAIAELVGFVEASEARPIAYNMYLSEDGRKMTVFQIHPDSASLEFHMKAAATIFGKFASLLQLSAMDVYGDLDESLLEVLRKKAQMLGGGGLGVHKLEKGFVRWAAATER